MDSLSNHLAQLTELIGRMETHWLRWDEGFLSDFLFVFEQELPWNSVPITSSQMGNYVKHFATIKAQERIK